MSKTILAVLCRRVSIWTFGALLFAGLSFGQTPVVNSVVNGGDFSPRLSPGCGASIFGANLSGATVTVGAAPAYVIFNSASQLNIQIPYSVSAGPATVTVTQGTSSASVSVTIANYSPAFVGTAVFNNSSQPITLSNPAMAGQALTAFLFGLGATTPPGPSGPTPTSTQYSTTSTPILTLTPANGGSAIGVPQISFSGLAPSATAQYQINFTLPAGLAAGMYTLTVSIGGQVSNTYPLPVATSTTTAVNITNGTNLGTYTIGFLTLPLTATGGNGLYTWSVSSGSLPPGLAIRTDIPGFPAAIAGIATAPNPGVGTKYSFTLQATSGGNQSTLNTQLRITGLVGKDNFRLPDAFTGVPYSYTFTPEGNTGSVTFNNASAATGLPSGMSLSAGGVLSTAAGNTGNTYPAGTYNISLNFTDSATGDTCFRGYQLTVSNLMFNGSGLLPNATQNGSYSASVSATGGDGNYTFSGSMPNGLSLNSSTGAITGTANFSGKWNFNITVSDGPFGSYTKNFAIDSIPSPIQEPSISTYGNLSDCTYGSPCFQGFGVNNGTAPYTWNVTGLPLGMDFTTGANVQSNALAPGDMSLWGAPLAPAGTYNITVTVTDHNGITATQMFPLHVSNLGLFNGIPNGTFGAQYNGTASGYSFIILGGSASYSARLVTGALPAGMALNGLALSGTPLESGNFSTQFTFTDTTAPTPNTLTLNQGPFINGPAGSTISISSSNVGSNYSLNTNVNVQLNACCAGSITWSAPNGLPAGFALSPAGLLTGSTGTPGNYSFLAKATDSSNPANFAIRLITFGFTPLVFTMSQNLGSTNVGAFYSQVFSGNGATGTVNCTAALNSYLPPGLSFSGCVLSGHPTQSGQYSFNVTATDSATPPTTITASFNLAVYPAGVPPPVFFNMGTNLGTWSIGEIQDQLFAGGGNGTYTWGFVSGTMPPGLSLRTDRPSFFNSTASAGLIGVATTPGTYAFTLSVTSAGQTPIQQTFTMKIVSFTVMDAFNMPDAFAGQAYSYQLTPLNVPQGATATFAQCGTNPFNLPPGLTLNSNGLISGTVATNITGTYSIQFSYSDGADTACRQITLRVFAIAISFTGPAPGVLPNATQNSPYTAAVAGSGGTGLYTWTASGLPSGLSITTGLSSLATISGTPTNVGNFNFQLTATDQNHVAYTENVNIDTIGVPAQLPRITPNGNALTCTIGWPCSQGAGVNSGGTAPFTWSVTGLPAGMSYRQGSGVMAYFYSPGNVEIWGSPTVSGSFPVTFTVTDANQQTTSQTFTLNVSNLVVDNSLSNGTYGVAYSSTMRVVGGTPPYKAIAGFGVLPSGLTFPSTAAPAGITVSGTPVESGSFNQQYLISDSGGQSIAFNDNINIAGAAGTNITVNTTILGPFTTGTVLNTTLSASGASAYNWSFPAASPSFLSLSAGGALTGTLSTPGVYQFLVKATDQSNALNFGIRMITLTVTPLLINPTSLPYGNVGTSYSQTLTVTGATGAIAWSVGGGTGFQPLPPGFTLSGSGAASATLQGPAGGPATPGQYFFTITALDSTTGFFTTRGFTLNFYPAGVVPPLFLGTGPNIGIFSAGPFIQNQLTPTGGQPPYTLSYTPGAAPIPGVRVQNGGPFPTSFASTTTAGLLGLIPAPGVYSSSIRVTDNLGTTFDRAINATVVPLTNLSSTTLPKATVNSPYSFQFTPYGGSGNYSWSATNLPGGLAFSTTTPGLLTGTPTASGSFSPAVTVKDLSNSTSIPFTYTLVVNPYAITNNAVLPQGAIGSPYSTTLTASNVNCGSVCTWTIFSGGLPGGLSLNGSTGVISGTPNGISNGSFTVQATGSAGTVQMLFALQVVAATIQPLLINTGSQLGDTGLGGQVNTQLTVQGGTPPYSWSVTAGSLPLGISLNGPGETLSSNDGPGFTFLWGRAQQAGSYTFTLTAKDSAATPLAVSQQFTWKIRVVALSYTSLPVNGISLVYGQAFSQGLLALGGSGSYAFSSPIMPPGLSMSSAGVVGGTPSNTGSITDAVTFTDTSIPANSGTQNVTYNIANSTGTAVTINAGPSLGTFQQGNTGGGFINLNPTGGIAPYTISALSTLPPGCAIETLTANNQLTTATANYEIACNFLAAGNYTFTVQATDSAAPPNIGVKTLSLTVAPFVLFNSTSFVAGSVGVPYSTTLITADSSGSSVTWFVTPGWVLPSGLQLIGNVISGTPTAAGSYTFVLSATDALGAVINYSCILNVSGLAFTNPPTSLGAGQVLQTATINQPFSFTFAATGGSPLTWSATGLPAGITMNATTGVLSGTPTSSGTFRVVVTVTAGASTVNRIYGLYVIPSPSILNITQGSTILPDAVAGVSYGPSLVPAGGTPPYTWSVAAGSSLPTGLSLVSGVNLPSGYTPGVTAIIGEPTTPGQYAITLICTDSLGAQLQRTFSLNVSTVEILGGSLKTGQESVAYNEQLTAVGGTAPYTFTYSALGINTPLFPTGIAATTTGLITGMPTSTGAYSFFATVTDSAAPPHTYTASYTLTIVNGPNNLEITTPIPFDLTVGKAYSVTEALSGGLAGATYTYSITGGALPAGLSLNTSQFAAGATGIIGAPTTAGPYSFTVHVTDGAGNTADRTYNGVVMPANQTLYTPILPVGVLGQAYNAGAGYQISYIGNTNASGYTFAESPLYPLPVGMGLSSTGLLSGAPQSTGSFLVYFSLRDNGTGLTSNTGGYTLYVTPLGTPAPLVTVAASHDLTVGVNQVFELDQDVQSGTPPYTWTVAAGSSLPPGMGLLAGSGGVSSYLAGTPTTSGTYTSVLQVTDAKGQTTTASVTMKIWPTRFTPDQTLDGPHGIVGQPYSFSMTISGGTPPYSVFPTSSSDMPPGVNFSSTSNTISFVGSPTYPGSFKPSITVTDSSSPPNSRNIVSHITIDAATGGAPGLSISPTTATINYVLSSPAPAAIPITINTTSGNVPFSAMVSGIPGATLSAISGSAPTTLSLNLTTLPTSVGTWSGVVAIQWQGSGFGYAAIPVTLTVAPFGQSFNTIASVPSGLTVMIDGTAFVTPQTVSWTQNSVHTLAAATQTTGNVRQAFASWSPGGSNGSIQVTAQTVGTTYTANFTTQYQLTTSASPANGGTVSGGGFYAAGTSVNVQATPAAGFSFLQFSGDVTSISNPVSVTMNAPKNVVSIFVTGGTGPGPNALRFVPVTPCRVADTRNAAGPFGGPSVAGGTTRDFIIPNSACGIPSTAQAYSLNVAVVPAGPLGFITMWPSGLTQPLASTLNSLDGRIKSNASIVPAGAGGAISVFASNTTDVVLDINGYFVPATDPTALAFFPVTPCRIADTRQATATFGASLAGGQSRTFPILSSTCNIPATARAYSLNLTAVPPGPLGFVTAWPTGQGQPGSSSLNALTGTVTANAAIVPAGAGGSIDIFASNGTQMVIDVNGYFAPMAAGGLSLYNVTPCRALDTRSPSGSPPFSSELDTVISGNCGIPSAAQAYVVNATVVPPTALGFLTLWPQSQSQPTVSTLNALDATITSNMAIVPTANGSVSAFASNPTHLILDIFGYFAP